MPLSPQRHHAFGKGGTLPNRVPLDNVVHRSLRVALRRSIELDHVNQALVVPGEFEEVQREYPIFLRKDQDGRFVAVALLGFEKGENLFVENGRWNARYVPATHSRGPFFLGLREIEELGQARSELAVHVDLDDPRVGTEDGELLFKEHGGNTTTLDHVTSRLQLIHHGLDASARMYALLDELRLIQPMELELQLGDGARYHVTSMFTIGMEQLQGLAGAELERLHRSGFLAPTIFIRSSLPNLNRLVELKERKLSSVGSAA